MSDRRAQLFAIDLLLAFIPLTIMLGMSANALSGVAFQVQDYANIYSLQRRTNDAADVLVKSPGTPPNWNSTIHHTVSGLAYYDNSTGRPYTNRIYSPKVYALTASDIENLTGTSNSFLNISFVTLQTSYEVGSDAPENAIDIAVAERYSNFQFAGDFGPFIEAVGVDETSPVDELCESLMGLSSPKSCAYDNVTDLNPDNGDFYLYVEVTEDPNSIIMIGNSTDNITFFEQSDFDLCTKYSGCDNTGAADVGDNCKLSGPAAAPNLITIYANFIWTFTDGTEYIPTPGKPVNSLGNPPFQNCQNSVPKGTAIVLLPPGFVQIFDELGVNAQATPTEPMNVYGIKVPPGMSWQLVNPEAFPNVMYPVKVTLKVWTE